MFDKSPPYDLDAEKSVIGSVLLDLSALDEALPHVGPDSFFLDANQRIFRSILRLRSNGLDSVDAVTLSNELERTNELEEVGGDRYLFEILDTVPHAGNAKYYAGIVQQKFELRQVIYAGTEAIKDAYNLADSAEVLAKLDAEILKIRESAITGVPGDMMSAVMATLDAVEKQESPFIPSGFYDLDDKIGGFRPGALIVIGARPGVGKTALVGNILLAAAKKQIPAMLISLEQSQTEIVERLLASMAKVNSRHISARSMDEQERSRFVESSAELSHLPLWIDAAASMTTSQVGALAAVRTRKNKVRIVAVDYLQFIEPDDAKLPREQQVASICRGLKRTATRLNVVLIALVQLNRAIESRPDKKPRKSDLRESGAIEQDADMIMFIDRPAEYDTDANPEDAELIIDKNRGGPTGKVKLFWDAETTTFRNPSHKEIMDQFADPITAGGYPDEEGRDF